MKRLVSHCTCIVAAALTGCAALQPPAGTGGVAGTTRRAVDAALQSTPARTSPAAQTQPPPAQALLPPLPAPRAQQRFDLIVTDTPAALVFEAIAQSSQLSIVVPPALAQERLSVALKEVDGVEALEILREQYGYEYRVDGRRVYVQPRELATRIYQVGFPAARRTGASSTRVASGSLLEAGRKDAGAQTAEVRDGAEVTTRVDGDVWADLERSLKAVVGGDAGRQVVVSAQTGTVIVRALPRELRAVERVINQMRLAIDRQVLLEAKIVEVGLNEGYEAGINWAALRGGNHRISMGADASRINVPGSIGSAFGIPPGSIVTGVDAGTSPPTVIPSTLAQVLAAPATSGALPPIAFTTAGFNALLSFLQTQGTVHVLSSPRVAAINNQKAVLRVGTDDFFLTGVETTTTATAGGTVTTPSLKMQPFFSGISLDVTPQIDDEGMVTLHVRPSISEVAERPRVVNLGNLGQFNLPLASASVNETDTVVRVRDGVTVAIGGLMQQRQAGGDARVPLLGDVPGLGALFRRDERRTEKRELVFLLRPTVVRHAGDWSDALAQLRTRIERDFGPAAVQ